MNEYSSKKIECYGKPMKLLNVYRIALVYIIIALPVYFLTNVFNNKPISTIPLIISITFFVLTVLSAFTISLLDKWAFCINIVSIMFQVVWLLINTVSLVVQLNISVGYVDIYTTITTILPISLMLFLLVLLIMVIREFVKHRKLFFTSFKDLKSKYESVSI